MERQLDLNDFTTKSTIFNPRRTQERLSGFWCIQELKPQWKYNCVPMIYHKGHHVQSKRNTGKALVQAGNGELYGFTMVPPVVKRIV